jgi:hypothetical protein
MRHGGQGIIEACQLIHLVGIDHDPTTQCHQQVQVSYPVLLKPWSIDQLVISLA